MNRFTRYIWKINNCFAFFVFSILKIKYYKKPENNRGLLFINTGTLGDAIISSTILDNEKTFSGKGNVYLIIRSEYSDLFTDYKGSIKIIFWNRKKYKWSLRYRLQFLNHLQNLHIKLCINLTSSRGISSDEIALLSGSTIHWCFNNTWKTLNKTFGKIMDSYYDKILFEDEFNEYERHEKLLKQFSNEAIQNRTAGFMFNYINDDEQISNYSREKNIVIAPLSADKTRTWGEKNYGTFCELISRHVRVLLVGTEQERIWVEKIRSGNNNVINLAGRLKLNEIVRLFKNSSLFVGNDSGLAHLALKLEIPMISIIGGGNFNKYFPFNETGKRIYIYHQMDCFGCEWICRFNEKHCLTGVNPNSVYKVAKNLLGLQ